MSRVLDLLFVAGYVMFVVGLWFKAPWLALVCGGIILMGIGFTAAVKGKI